jgi:hypothetical protein
MATSTFADLDLFVLLLLYSYQTRVCVLLGVLGTMMHCLVSDMCAR